MKIHIFGCSGSGKTWLSNKLSKENNLLHFDLDDIFWDNNQGSCGIKTPVEKRSELLNDILVQNDWIIEGVFYAWLSESFKAADKIIILDVPLLVCKLRIIKRFIKRKLGIEPSKKESFKSVINLLKWTNHFRNTNFPEALEMMKQYQDKLVFLSSKKAINTYRL